MAKQPALITRYKAATAELSALKTAHADLEKKLAEATKTKDYASKMATDLRNEIDQIQSVIDALPNTVPRRSADSYSDTPLLVRFAAFLATR